MKRRKELPVPEPGDLLAVVEDGETIREYSVQQIRIQPTMNRWIGEAASIGSDWIPAGYELCSRVRGERAWVSEKLRGHTVSELVDSLAGQLDIPDKALRHPRAIELRRELRLQEKKELGWEG